MRKTATLIREAFARPESRLFRIVNDLLALNVVYAVVTVILSTDAALYARHKTFFDVSEWVTVAIFIVEYIAYVALAKKKTRYIFSFYGIIDLLAILPTLFLAFDLRALKLLRGVRILRLFRMFRLLKLVEVGKKRLKKNAQLRELVRLNIQLYFVAVFTLIAIFGTLMYYLERGAPGATIDSAIKGMWFTLGAMATVGFSDVLPVSAGGRVLTVAIIFSGLALFGMLINIVGRTLEELIFGKEAESELAEATMRPPEELS